MEELNHSNDRHLYDLAVSYHLDGLNQLEIARKYGVSRTTISRLLAEARTRGIVRIEVVRPAISGLSELEAGLSTALGLREAYVVSDRADLGDGLARALSSIDFAAGDALLVGSGRWVYTALQAPLPKLPGVVVAPTIGGQEEPDPWYQTNELTRMLAAKVGGYPCFMFAPALPSAELYDTIIADPSVRWARELWDHAKVAIVGIGAAPLSRTNLPRFVAGELMSLRPAVGDVGSRFIDVNGEEVAFAGSSNYLAISLEQLRGAIHSIGVTSGEDRVTAVRAAASHGYISRLVTDAATAAAIIAASPAPNQVAKPPC